MSPDPPDPHDDEEPEDASVDKVGLEKVSLVKDGSERSDPQHASPASRRRWLPWVGVAVVMLGVAMCGARTWRGATRARTG